MRPARLGLLTLLLTGVCLASAGSASAACPVSGCPDPGGGVTFTLSIQVNGSGAVKQGAVIRCSETGLNSATKTCDSDETAGDTLTLTPAADSGVTFFGWSGDCSGTGSCSVTMDGNQAVTATFVDNTAPAAPTISSPASGQVIQSTTGGGTSVAFSGDGETTAFRCAVDNVVVPTTDCTSPWFTGSLSTGTHTAHVWAKDANGNLASSTRDFKVVNLPQTTLSGTPAGSAVTSSKSTDFSYSSDTGTSYECTLDGNPVLCDADVGPLGEGAHTFQVAAGVSPFGDGIVYHDSSPASRTWTVDSVAPSVTISSGPDEGTLTAARSATIGFSGSDPSPGTALDYTCALDNGTAAPCSGSASYDNLAPGQHSVRVVATDRAGNSSSADRSWTVIVDNDSDGSFNNSDCNDGNAAIHPGAFDVPGNGVDEDCSGTDAAPVTNGGGADAGATPSTTTPPSGTPNPGTPEPGTPNPVTSSPGTSSPGTSTPAASASVAAKLKRSFKVSSRGALIRTLKLAGVTSGAHVTVSCKGKGCAFRSKNLKLRHGASNLATMFKKKLLKAGAVITIKISHPGMKTKTFVLTVRRKGQPKLRT